MSSAQQTFEEFALASTDAQWELHRGQLVEKPSMSFAHNDVASELFGVLHRQLDRKVFRVRLNAGHVKSGEESYLIPDVMVFPATLFPKSGVDLFALEVYGSPISLVVEVWSPSTGRYDIEAKLPIYRERGDLEIWRLRPRERELTTWRRRPDGSYTETVILGGEIEPVALPGVTVDLDALFEF